MVDPYAPPVDSPAPRPASAYTPPTGQAPLTQTYDAPPTADAMRRRDRPLRDRLDRDRDRLRDEPRSEPARPGLFWIVAAVGIGMLCLSRLILYFAVADELDGDVSAAGLLAVLGIVALSVGLVLAAVLQRGLATPWRIALLLGGGFFAVLDWGGLGLLGIGLL